MILGDDFEILDTLFQNQSTIIYRAKLIADNKTVIIKTLNNNFPSSADVLKIKHEYEILKALTNVEGVIQVSELFEGNNTLMVFENIEGDILKNIFLKPDNPISNIDIEALLKVAIQVTDALNNIHLNHVVHKDISPDNIIYNSNTNQVKIIDFGISSQLSFEQHSFQNHNELEGKLAYMSPEQTGRINKILDYRGDLYSLGVTLYELFTGQRPFDGCEGLELIHAHIAISPTPPHEINHNIPLLLSKIIMRLLAKMADERYQTANGLAYDLLFCLENIHAINHKVVLGQQDKSAKLQIKQKLYGREKEVESLLNAFERVSLGSSEIILLSGSSGTGKSVLAQEIHQPLTRNKGLFISGKFDQNQCDIPFYGWNLMFASLADYILKEDEVSLIRWKTVIKEAIAHNGQVLIDAIPAIELIIGKQTDEAILSGTQAANRFNYIIKQFINAIASPEHPLVIFIDDWQWADAASIDLLKYLMTDNSHEYILFICAYRREEVENNHPFSLALDVIDNSAIPSDIIYLNNLSESDSFNLINDALQQPAHLRPLADIIYKKNQGNAFFLVQFLSVLENKKLLEFDLKSNQWCWQLAEIEMLNITNNVVELMVDKIEQLPKNTQKVIQYASCLGHQFSLIDLANMIELSIEQVASIIFLPLKEGILTYKNNSYYFIHDRVHEAAYSLLDNAEKVALHHRIALSLLNTLSTNDINNKVFDIAQHLNKAIPNLTAEKDRALLLSINIQAGNQAKKATAYDLAFFYYSTAIKAVSEQCWTEKTIILYIKSAEVAYLLRKFAQMEQWIDTALLHAKTAEQKAQAWTIRLQAYTAQNRLSDAVDASLLALTLLGIKIPKKPNNFQVFIGLVKTKKILKQYSLDELLLLPEMTDEKQLLVMDILGLTIPPAFWTSSNLAAMITFKLTQASVEKGYAPISGYAFSWWAITECAMLGNIDSGDSFGRLGIALAEKNSLYIQQPTFFSGWMINNYKHALKDSLPFLEKAYSLALGKGDFEYASYALNNNVQHRLHIGEPLPQLLERMKKSHQVLEDFNVKSSLYWHNICWQLALNLTEQEYGADTLSGTIYDEVDLLPLHLRENDGSTLFFLYFAKLMQSIIFNNVATAIESIDKIRPYLQTSMGTHQNRLFYFYESLSLLANNSGTLDKYKQLLRVRLNQRKLKKWAKFAPMNHLHHWYLVEAEYMRVIGKPAKAMSYYNLAIEWANKNAFIHEEALAYELVSRFHIAQKQQRFASYDLIQAHYLYTKWGAHGKAMQLLNSYSKQFPKLLSYNHPVDNSSGSGHNSVRKTSLSGRNSSSQLDLQTIIKSSQLIAGEVVFEELIKTFSTFIIENSGAQRFILLTVEGKTFTRAFESRVVQDDIVTKSFDNQYVVENSVNVPSSLLYFVQRTHQSVNLANANIDHQFANDQYFMTENVQSVFCAPILLQGKLTGIIYLENKLLSGVFTSERIELIHLLSLQAAISIENSILYSNLEEKVVDRTHQLEQANKDLTMLATTDSLTQLANRHLFNERMILELNRAKRKQSPLSVLLCDIDHFKKYNDNYGHIEGDDCLQKVAQAFKTLFSRATDLAARYGGEEFAVILPEVEAEEARILGDKLCQCIQALDIPHQHNAEFGVVTISVGCYSIIPSVEESNNVQIKSLLLKVDEALYQAKESGRNQVVLWQPSGMTQSVIG